MEKKSKERVSPSDRLLKRIESDKAILKRVKTDIQTVSALISSDVSRLEKLQRYYLDLFNRIRLYEEQLFRLKYGEYGPWTTKSV